MLRQAPSVKQKADLRLTYGDYNPNASNLLMDAGGGGGGDTGTANLTLAKVGGAAAAMQSGANAGLRAGRQAYDDGPPLFDSSDEDD